MLAVLGLMIAQDQSAQDSSAQTVARCIGFESQYNSLCALNASGNPTKSCSDPSFFSTGLIARQTCCTFAGITCSNRNFTDSRFAAACSGVVCAGPTTQSACINGSQTISLQVCKDNPNYTAPSTGNPVGVGSGTIGGTQNENESCSISTFGGTSNCIDGLSCCTCNTGGYRCGGKNFTCSKICSAQGATETSAPVTGGQSTSSSCTPIAPTVVKLVSPRNNTEIVENKVTLSWNKNGSFGKECFDNGKPDRFVLRYTTVNIGKDCPANNNTRYKSRELVEKVKGQQDYSVELSNLTNNKKYCWFIRKRNGQQASTSNIRSFITNFTIPTTTPEGLEGVKVTQGATTADEIKNPADE